MNMAAIIGGAFLAMALLIVGTLWLLGRSDRRKEQTTTTND
jgi:hypothetical protein